ncbi:MAG: MlaD family protein, partial [Acidimicrobiales bacterium]
QNLAPSGDVEMAGVPVGVVTTEVRKGRYIDVTMDLHRNAPLHKGATLQIRPKTTLNETYVQIFDGNGPALPSHTFLPIDATRNNTTINDLLNKLDPTTRAAVGPLLVELQGATAGQGDNLGQLLAGLGEIGRTGHTVYDVFAAQSGDLQQLVKQTATLMAVLDEGQGQIADLTTVSQNVNAVTAANADSVSQVIQALPPLMTQINNSSGSIQTLASTLAPIASNLRAAAPDLNASVVGLQPEYLQLRDLLPTLQTTLQESPPTLVPIQTTAQDLTALSPPAGYFLSDFDPFVAYMQPYRQDMGAFYANFGASGAHAACANPPQGCQYFTQSQGITYPPPSNNDTVGSNTLPANAIMPPNSSNPAGQSPSDQSPGYQQVTRAKY